MVSILPNNDKGTKLHPFKSCLILVCSWSSLDLYRWSIFLSISMPKNYTFSHPISMGIHFFSSVEIGSPKLISTHFCIFNLYPDTAGRVLSSFVKYRMTSSAYNTSLCGIPVISTPSVSSFLLILTASGSIHKAKIKGESGSPCLVPLLSSKGLDSILLILTWAFEIPYIACNQEMKMLLKPKLQQVSKMKGQATLSNAFSATRVSMRACLLFFWTYSIMFSVRLTLPDNYLFIMNPVWSKPVG